MNRRDGALLLATAGNNRLNVALYTIAGVAVVLSSIGFSGMIALYFGFDVLGLKQRPPFDILANNRTLVIIGAILSALVALVARISQTLLEARVIIGRERWFAERLRASPAAKTVPSSMSRASNFYGRLSAASMRAVSIVGVLIINLAGIVIALPPRYALAGVALILVFSVVLYAAMRALAAKVASATNGLFEHAKALQSWKNDHSQNPTEGVDSYYRSYHNRIFLGSTFSFTSQFFAFTFALCLLVVHELNLADIDFGQVFVVFTLLQAYLSLVGNFFGALVNGAALLPGVKPYSEFIPGYVRGPADEGPGDSKTLLAQNHLIENTPLEEL